MTRTKFSWSIPPPYLPHNATISSMGKWNPKPSNNPPVRHRRREARGRRKGWRDSGLEMGSFTLKSVRKKPQEWRKKNTKIKNLYPKKHPSWPFFLGSNTLDLQKKLWNYVKKISKYNLNQAYFSQHPPNISMTSTSGWNLLKSPCLLWHLAFPKASDGDSGSCPFWAPHLSNF